jgi:hypothetical protein
LEGDEGGDRKDDSSQDRKYICHGILVRLGFWLGVGVGQLRVPGGPK